MHEIVRPEANIWETGVIQTNSWKQRSKEHPTPLETKPSGVAKEQQTTGYPWWSPLTSSSYPTHHHILQASDRLKRIVISPTIIAFRCPKRPVLQNKWIRLLETSHPTGMNLRVDNLWCIVHATVLQLLSYTYLISHPNLALLYLACWLQPSSPSI